jgi:2-polyprenyl-3-methyl-5-hydroxy-6-metoxy-1,4-benzoquinol methylase
MSKTNCYVCGSLKNEVALVETPLETRFGSPVLPDIEYRQRRCKNCGLLFVDCDVTEDFLNNLYAKESVDWQRELIGSDVTVGASRLKEFGHLCDLIFRMRNPKSGESLLDFGCQTGEFGFIATQKGSIKPYGVEMSSDYARVAEARGGFHSVHVGSLATAPFTDGQFDYISAQEVLEHMVDPLEAIKKFRTLIKSDGLLLITVPSSHYFVLKKRIYSLWAPNARALVHTHLYNFTPSSMRILMEKADFEIISMKGVGWHGAIEPLGTGIASLVRMLSGGTTIYSPSLMCIARPSKLL